jgi:hypothetical protein
MNWAVFFYVMTATWLVLEVLARRNAEATVAKLAFELHSVKTENEYIKTHELSTVRAQCAKLTALISQCNCESKLPVLDAPSKPRLVSQMAAFEHNE